MKRLMALLLLCFPLLAGAQTITWPGQAGNLVGYQNYGDGTLGTASCGTITSGSAGAPHIYRKCTMSSGTLSANYVWFIQVDFQMGTSGLTLTGSNDLFVGSRFQSNNIQNYNVQQTGSGANNTFLFDSFTPLASFYTSPPGEVWPSAGSASNSTTMTDDMNCVGLNKGYEYGLNVFGGGSTYVDSSDFWGGALGIGYYTTTAQMIAANNWVHDFPQYSGVTGGNYHLDGIGYLNGTAAPSNVQLSGNVVASLGNSNSIAFQVATSGYDKINLIGNYVSGDGYTVSPGDIAPQHFTNSAIAFNVLSSAIKPIFGGLHGSTLGTNSSWECNKIAFYAGTTWSSGWTPTSAMNGQYWLPSNASPNSSTDNGGNTFCFAPNKYSLDFLGQKPGTSSSAQTITLYCNNTGNCSSTGVSLVTGTQFSITSNTCGTGAGTVNSGSTCSFSVVFSPSSRAVASDSVVITSNMNSPANSYTIPVVGFGDPNGIAGASDVPGRIARGMLMAKKVR